MVKLKSKREDAAIVLITHNLGVVAETCDRVIVMYGGKIQEIGDVFSIFNEPKHPYTKGLLQSLPDPYKEEQGMLKAIPGIIPHILELPAGCKFCTRCTEVMDKCWNEEPELKEIAGGRTVRCHLF
jgi:oligopeptide/dipeptide ABC transporter ATP-binding protein